MKTGNYLTRVCLLGSITLTTGACGITAQKNNHVLSTTQCDFRPVLSAQQNSEAQRLKEGDTSIPESVSSDFHVNMLDKSISNKIQVHKVDQKFNETGAAMVSAVFVNCTDHPLWVQGRTQFLDPISGDAEISAWKTVQLAARTQEIYRESSLSDQGVSVKSLEVREGF